MNFVNENNFNETCRGYVLRALKIARELEGEKLSIEQEKLVLSGLRWAFDEMTLDGARKEAERGEVK